MRKTFVRFSIIFMILCIMLPLNSSIIIVKGKEINKENINLNIAAEGAVLIDMESGELLYGKNATVRVYPASTTKILTALVAIELGELEEYFTVGDEIKLIDPDSSRAWLRVGEKMKLSELIMGLMLPSGNDAAYTIGVNLGRKLLEDPSADREKALGAFMERMNERAREIGAVNSNFTNPHGIHDPKHYTTPYDMALIAKEGMKYDYFKKVVKTLEHDGVNLSGQGHLWFNTNRLLNSKDSYFYKYTTGIKTGHTTNAGYCLVSSGEDEEMKVIVAIFKSDKKGQWQDSIALLNHGLNDFSHFKIAELGKVISSIEVVNAQPWKSQEVEIVPGEELIKTVNKKDIENIKSMYEWRTSILNYTEKEGIELLRSIKKGEVIGRAKYYIGNKELGAVEILAGNDINKRWFIFNIPGVLFLYENWMFSIPVFVLVIISVVLIGKARRNY